jgi:hypothetical protein
MLRACAAMAHARLVELMAIDDAGDFRRDREPQAPRLECR